MNSSLALKQVREGQVSSVYVCFGDESFLIEQFTERLSSLLVEREHRDFALSHYDLADHPISAVIDDVETLPFMVPRKVVLAKNATFLTASGSGKNSANVEHDVDRLMSYIQTPVDYTVLVLIIHAPKLDERRKVVKRLREFASVISFNALSDRDLSAWVVTQVEQSKCHIDHEAVRVLLQNSGSNLQTLHNEINKLALFAGSGGHITTAMIEQLAVRSLEHNIFKLIDEIVARRIDRALALLNDMFQQREEPILILMLIARQFRIMTQVKHLAERGNSQQQIASQLKLRPFVVRGAIEQGRRYNANTLRAITAHLANLDYEMKMGKINKEMALELFILKLA